MNTEHLPICPLCDKLYEPKDYETEIDICPDCERKMEQIRTVNNKEDFLDDYYHYEGDIEYD